MLRIGVIAIFCALATATMAASLRVAPTTVDLVIPDSTSVLNLHNDADRPIDVQVRIFRWRQSDGVEKLELTDDVVASPPAARLNPNADYVVRLVRVSKSPVKTEECFRVIVDELPDPSRRKAGTVNLVLRHSIPIFFRNPDATAPDVHFSLSQVGKALVLTAENVGGSRLRLSNVSLVQGGKNLVTRAGLFGYVHAGATMKWSFAAKKTALAGPLKLKAQTDSGPIEASVEVRRP